MIRVIKSNPPPPILTGEGQEKWDALCAAYDGDPQAYNSVQGKFDIEKEATYKDQQVMEALRRAQSSKCCYCETILLSSNQDKKGRDQDHDLAPSIEHFRPKGGYRQAWKGAVGRPGYYWLAYEWSNLFLSCQKCNNNKDSYFPLGAFPVCSEQ